MEQPISSKSRYWMQKIQQQQESGMKINHWCQQQQVPYDTFAYWKRRLKKINLTRSSFAELPDKSHLQTQDISIECTHFHIHLNPACPPAFLRSLLTVLLELKC